MNSSLFPNQVLKLRRNEFALVRQFLLVNAMLFAVSLASVLWGTTFFEAPLYLIVNVALIISKLASFRLKTIIFFKEQDNVTLELDKWLFIKKRIYTSVNELNIVVKRQHSERSSFSNFIHIYVGDQLIIRALSGFSGWREEELLSFFKSIKSVSNTVI